MTDLIIPPLDEDPNTIFGQKLSELADIALEGDCTEWEYGFIINMVDRFEKGLNFTDRQVEMVNELYEQHCR